MKVLFFGAHGVVELRDGSRRVWSSDSDDDFQEATGMSDFPDPSDDDEVETIVDYLIDEELLDEGEEFDIHEEDLQDFDDDADEDDDDDGDDGNVIEGKFERVR